MLQSYHKNYLSKFEPFMPSDEDVESSEHKMIMDKLNKVCDDHQQSKRKLCDKLMNNPKFFERLENKSTSVASNEVFLKRLTAWDRAKQKRLDQIKKQEDK